MKVRFLNKIKYKKHSKRFVQGLLRKASLKVREQSIEFLRKIENIDPHLIE